MAGLTHENSIFGKAETDSKSSPEGDVGSSPLCPRCHSKRVWRDAKRFTPYGFEIQRWSCRDCGRRFSDPDDTQRVKEAARAVETVDTKLLKSADGIVTTRQICVTETKNLDAEQQKTGVLLRNEAAITNGKIVEYEFWLLKRGYAQSTIEGRVKIMKRLVKLGANLFDPESIKDVLAKQTWSDGRKEYVTEAYTNFLIMVGGKWDPPKYCRVETRALDTFHTY